MYRLTHKPKRKRSVYERVTLHQAMGSWAQAPGLRHLATSNPGIQAIGSWA